MTKNTDQFVEAVNKSLKQWELFVSHEQIKNLTTHYLAMLDSNQRMNLTRITDPVEAAVKHYVDSLSLLKWVEQKNIDVTTVLDVGTGAGFPSFPLAVMKPDWELTAIDGTGKKINFLQQVIESTLMVNLHVKHTHSDHWDTGQTFSLVLTKATAPLSKCLTFAAKLTSVGGYFVAYKTASLDSKERADADERIKTLPLQAEDNFPYDLKYFEEVLHRKLYVYRRRNV